MQIRENHSFIQTPVDSPFNKRYASIHQYSAQYPLFRKAPSKTVTKASDDIIGIFHCKNTTVC